MSVPEEGERKILKMLREATKKVLLVTRTLRPYTPPTLEFSGHIFFPDFFIELQKTVFFLSGQSLPPS